MSLGNACDRAVFLALIRNAFGGLIVILRNGRLPARNPPAALPAQRPAELYQLDPSENYPVPVVAVNVTWNDELWPLPIVRAAATTRGSDVKRDSRIATTAARVIAGTPRSRRGPSRRP